MYESSSSQLFRTTTGIQSGPDTFGKSMFAMTFKNHIGSYRNIMQFQISPKRENSKEIPKSSRLEFLEKFSANNFVLSDAEDNTSRLLNRDGIADLPSFWEVIDSFVLLTYAGLAGSRTLLQRLLACLNFIFIQKIYSVGTNEKSDFYELWQQQKQLKTMEMNET